MSSNFDETVKRRRAASSEATGYYMHQQPLGCDVLIVEDDSDIAMLVCKSLEAIGLRCVTAEDVWAGVELFRLSKFDLVITDFDVPGGGAKELVHAIREDDVDVPILLISGRMDKKDLGDMIREAVDEFNEKPLQMAPFFASINRLLVLGDQRRRTKERAAKLLDISSKMKLGGASDAVLQMLVQAVAEVTPFRKAVLALTAPGSAVLRSEAALGTFSQEPLDPVYFRHAYSQGFRLDIASFVPLPGSGPPQRSDRFNQTAARERAWQEGDQILVEIPSEGKLWGYLRVWDPCDGSRPTEDAMRMLALLGHNFATTLENRELYRRQIRLNFQMRVLGEVVKTALRKSDLEFIKKMLTDVVVNRFGNSLACFVEKQGDGRYVVDSVACRSIADYAEPLAIDDEAAARLAEIEQLRTVLHRKKSEGGASLLGRQKKVSSLAIPIYSGDTLRHILVIEDEASPEFSESDVATCAALADQVGLVWSNLLYQKYLEKTAVQLNDSYDQLKAANETNVKLQEIVRRYVPASTWDAALAASEANSRKTIESLAERPVMFVDIVGFTRFAENASAEQIVELLNIYFTVVSSIIAQQTGEVIKYIGDGIMAHFPIAHAAIRASDDILRAQKKLNRQIASLEIGEIALRIGVAYGPVILGHVGPFYHQDRTLLGDTVNTAARLEKAARPGTALLDVQLIPPGDSLEDYELTRLENLLIRGKSRPVQVMTFVRDRALYSD